jgi:thiol peroxidase
MYENYLDTNEKYDKEKNMAKITLQGNPITTFADLPALKSNAPDFKLVKSDLSEITLCEFKGKNVILNIFPSLDTSTCAASVRRFNKEAASLKDTIVLCISADLPFAAGRFCTTEGIEDVYTGSVFRNPDFGKDYGVEVTSGPLTGLLSRSLVVVDKQGKVVYTQQVPETTDEPDYAPALAAVK